METFTRFIIKFGHLIILINLILLTSLIFFNHLGYAEKLGNFLLFVSIFIVSIQIFKIKANQPTISKRVFYDRFLVLGWIGVVLVMILVFRAIFLSSPAVWGDAPYFYPESFKDFFSQPLVWESRGRLGVVNDLYWIYPFMLIYSGLGVMFDLSNDIVIRLVFYFPAIFFSFLSPWLLTRYLGFSSVVRIFSTAVYSLNTYFILLIDGGQVGVVLAYGLFPLTLLHLHKLMVSQTISQFFLSLSFCMLLIIADVRFAVIAVFAFSVWHGLEHLTSFKKISSRQLLIFVFLFFALLMISLYWLIPALIIKPTTGSGSRSDLQLISVLNPLFLFSPHWPINEFGKIIPPQWFFAGIPFLIFGNLFFKRNRQAIILILIFLIFVLLAKGISGFLGNIYAWVVDTIPMGGAFRDSTKFFTPLILYAGILIGLSVENLCILFKKPIISLLTVIFIFGYLIVLLYPAVSGNMYGVLAYREFPMDMQIVTNKISSENGFFRTVWFPERHPLAFSTERKPALDAKMLVNLRPFASLNAGDSDKFNFLHNKQFLEWLDIFGIRYLVFSGDTRKVFLDEENKRDWDNLLNLVGDLEGLEKVYWGTTFPVYKTNSSKPRFFAVDKVFAVVGGDDVYQKLIGVDKKFSIGNQGFVFFEDGKFNPRSLLEVSSNSAVIIFNQKEKKDLVLSFLSEFFQSPVRTTKSRWALRRAEEYLKWKFELLVHGVETNEFDYGKGIAFSSQPNEKLVFNLSAPKDGKYILAVRHMSVPESSFLKVSLKDQEEEIPRSEPKRFSWYTKQMKLNAGRYDLVLKNLGGFQVVNTVALIPISYWESSSKLTEKMLSKFPLVNNINALNFLSNWHKVSYSFVSPVEYSVEVPAKMSWLVFTDSYHPKWNLGSGRTDLHAYPFYSTVNGFYIGQNGLEDGKLFFKEQNKLRVAVGLSLVSLVVLVGVFIWIYYTNKQSLISRRLEIKQSLISRRLEIKQSLKFLLRSNFRRKKDV